MIIPHNGCWAVAMQYPTVCLVPLAYNQEMRIITSAHLYRTEGRNVMTAQSNQKMSVEAYLAFERNSETKHEYIAGDILAMSGASVAHNIITGNTLATLHAQVLQRNCTIFPSDMRLGLVRQNIYVYPDVTVVCGDIEFGDTEQDTVINPTVIIEVLSPSTENYDRGKKSQYYRTISSLQEYLLVAQDAHYIEHFVRYSEHQWLLSEMNQEQATVYLASIDCTLQLKDIYNKVQRRGL
jgi:Uma2 family endonuclease